MQNEPAPMVFRSRAAETARAAALQEGMERARAEAAAGNHAAAADRFRACLGQAPDHSDAWAGLGAALRRIGDLAGATQALGTAVALCPSLANAHFGLADVLRRQGQPQLALESCQAGLALDPTIGEGHILRAAIRKDLADFDGAVADLKLVLSAYPLAGPVHVLLNEVFCAFGRLDEAAVALREAMIFLPQDVTLHRRLTATLVKLRRPLEAIAAGEALVAIAPDDAEAHRGLAVLYQERGRIREAFETYQKAIALNPRFARAYTNLATLIMGDHRLDLATDIFRVVIGLTPMDATAYHNLGVALRLQAKLEEAAENFRKAIELKGDYFESLVELCHIRQHFCDWDGLVEQQEQLFAASYRKGKPVPPFAVITSSGATPQDQVDCARAWALRMKERVETSPLVPYAPRPLEDRKRRIKVGYVSMDFHNHATAMLIVELIEKHDKARFETVAFSFGPDDGSLLRQRLVNAFETFVDLRGIATAEATQRILAHKVDILIDLKGYTQDARSEIFAARPAPIQVSYLGYPGTMGADFIDYMIVDPIVAPPDHARLFDEKLVYLPNCYQPNDRQRLVAPETPSRADCGLPETGFIFCSFNNSYKINERIFTIWMRLLRETPGSVLWLLEPNPVVAKNLRREAAQRGIDPERLVFAPRIAADRHLARFACADLFLDTLPVNAHTTASEALWVGLPVLTCLGDSFIGRVAASLLRAVGLPELVATSLDAYEAKALELAHSPAALKELRLRLDANRPASPLFDTARYVRNFEAALLHMAKLRDAGHPPDAFVVNEKG